MPAFIICVLILSVAVVIGEAAVAEPAMAPSLTAEQIAKVAEAQGGVSLETVAGEPGATEMTIPLQVPVVGTYEILLNAAGTAPYAAPQMIVDREQLGPAGRGKPVVLAEGTEILELHGQMGKGLPLMGVELVPVMRDFPPQQARVLGPFGLPPTPSLSGANGLMGAMKTVFAPERDPEGDALRDLGDGNTVAWSEAKGVGSRVDLSAYGAQPGAITYVRTYFYVPNARKVALAWVASGGAKIWVAGRLVQDYAPNQSRGAFLTDAKVGWNSILVKVPAGPQASLALSVSDPGDVRFAKTAFEGDMALAADDARANYPQIFLTNGLVKLRVYPPNAGFYHGPRFDWSGMINHAEYQGHSFFGPWKFPHDAKANDAAIGTADELGMGAFNDQPPLGYEEAKPGETFVKIGAGILLRSDDQPYGFSHPYKVVYSPPWEVTHGENWAEFHQICHGPRGWAYDYTKRITLPEGKPQFIISRRLKNLGAKTIVQPHYCHNFLQIDGGATGPNYVLQYAFAPKVQTDPTHLIDVTGNDLRLTRELGEHESFFSLLEGFQPLVLNNNVTVENIKTGASIHIVGDHPVVVMPFWANRKVCCAEPNIIVTAAPGDEMTWSTTYTLSAR